VKIYFRLPIITSPENVAADGGPLSGYYNQFSESSMSYRRIFIKTEGDYFSKNLNLFSGKVDNWLNSAKTGTHAK
jgi:hypothetical protein